MRIKIIKEVKKDTPQYKEASSYVSSRKTALDSLFGTKKRIVIPFESVPPALLRADASNATNDISEASSYIASNSLKRLMFYTQLDQPSRTPEEAEKKRRLKQDPTVVSIGNILSNTKDDKREETISNILMFVLKRYTFFNLSVDLSSRKIFSPKKGGNQKYDLIRFMDLHLKAAEESLEFVKQNEDKFIDSRDKFTNIKEILTGDPFTPSGRKFYELLQTMYHTDITPNDMSFLLFNKDRSYLSLYAPDNNYVLDLKIVISILNKFGFEMMTNKIPRNMSIVITRVPLEVVRMSDFPQLESCHSVGGSHASCATQESISKGGAVAYLIRETFNPAKRRRMEEVEREFLKDADRGIRGSNPMSRIRLRTFRVDMSNGDRYIVSIPAGNLYGAVNSSFIESLTEYLYKAQSQTINEISNLLSQNKHIDEIFLYGGGYYEGDPEADLAEFLKLSFSIPSDNREYKENINVNEVDKDSVEDNYKRYLSYMIKKHYSGITSLETRIYVEVDKSRTGYRSGESRPSNIDPDVKVNVEFSISKKDLEKNIKDHFAGLYKLDQDVLDSAEFIKNFSQPKKLSIDIEDENDDFVVKDYFLNQNPYDNYQKDIENFLTRITDFEMEFYEAKNYGNYIQRLKDKMEMNQMRESFQYLIRN